MMDHIDGDVLRRAADALDKVNATNAVGDAPGEETATHTVKIELNGGHGGADMHVMSIRYLGSWGDETDTVVVVS